MTLAIPTVELHGVLRDHDGLPIVSRCWMVPRSETGCFQLGERLISTRPYSFDPKPSGAFSVHVLPTDFGVDIPWHYELLAGGLIYRLTMPGRYPANDLQRMLSAGAA